MLEITNVRNGAVLNHNHGKETAKGLEFTLEGLAEPDAVVTVDGAPVERCDRQFKAKILLTKKINTVTVTALDNFGILERRITLVWDKKSFKRYNYFIDDNSFFLTDLAKDRPKSLFDQFYLKALKKIHDKYGTKFTLNCFYRNDHTPFEMSAMPDTWKGEWKDNSDWLRLAFHAYSEFPDRPYQHATAEKLAADYDLVKKEIVRFAGKDTFTPPVVIHWGMCPPTSFHVLKERGMNLLQGAFINCLTYVGEKAPSVPTSDIGFYYEQDVGHYVKAKTVFYDSRNQIFLGVSAACCNLETKDEIRTDIKKAAADDTDLMCLMTHEQYSFPRYFNYIPDHLERVELSAKLAAEAGYKPVWYVQGLLGNTAWND